LLFHGVKINEKKEKVKVFLVNWLFRLSGDQEIRVQDIRISENIREVIDLCLEEKENKEALKNFHPQELSFYILSYAR